MNRSWWLFLFVCLLMGAPSCTVIEEEEFEHEVDPTIGEGTIYPVDSDTDSGTETDSGTDSTNATDSGTEQDLGTDTPTDI